jgi:type IV pilus assembly protein PilY1
MNKLFWKALVAIVVTTLGLHGTAQAQLIINDTLTGAASSYNWKALNGACLTAGNGTGTIPACSGLPYYNGKILVGGTSGRLPDIAGQGALRLTNGDVTSGGNGNNQTGAVVSNFTFPTNQGLQVTFTTVSYGGNGYNGTGADGISFFLMDGARTPSVGALGGSLGYSCSNVNGTYDGVAGAYLGIGMDEFGNFSNPGDNTDTGPGFHAGRISLRGAGDTAWNSLSTAYPALYPSALSSSRQANAVHNTCASGYLWDYSGSVSVQTNQKLPFNYPLIAYSDLPAGVSLANQEAIDPAMRANAVPITYSVNITQDGILDVSYSVNGGSAQKVLSNTPITASNGPLPSSFRFGFSSGTGGGSNVHEITCFKAAPVNQSNSSAGVNVQQSARVETGTQVYLAYYHPSNWWGQLTAQSLIYTASSDTVSINPVANWDASCTLTGGSCQATAQASVVAQGPGSRSILSWNGSTGIPFEWANLTAAQQTALTVGDSSATDLRLRYLRGDRTNEVASGGSLRTRTGVLGDIVDSSPTWVGPPSSPYSGPWVDGLNGTVGSEAQTYAAFKATNGTRQNIVYVGANDGLLHGFRSGAYDASGNFVSTASTPNDGLEALAYVPSSVLSAIHSTTAPVDYSSPQYSHNFYVDATPGTGDLYYGGAWHTWLVGGLGAGGNAAGPIGDKTSTATGAIYALDITDPSTFSEANAASLVKGEWSSSTIACTNDATCGTKLGSTFGTPVIRRLHNGNWAVLFGNGLNSSSGTAGLFIMLVDASGNKTFRFMNTGYGPSRDPLGANSKNGIAYVTPVDLDGDHITDYVYAGDVFGNVWRFDLTSATPASWSVSTAPIFSTPAGQPVTSKLAVASVPGVGAGPQRVVVSFGTGQQFPQTLTSAATYASSAQALYGIWDWNMAGWNSQAGAAAQYASLAAPQTVAVANLQAQSVTSTVAGSGSISGYRTISTNTVCWSGSTACGTGNNKFGWKLPLPASTEQVIYNPIIAYGMFVVNTTIPASTQIVTCDSQPASGYTMSVTMAGGGAAGQSFFGDANNNFVSINGGIVSGIGLSATGSPSIVTANKKPYLVQQTVGGTGVVSQINPGVAGAGGRLNWIKLR